MKNEQSIRYNSTGRCSGSESIAPRGRAVTFRQALSLGQAPDNGLFMPNRIPRLTGIEIRKLKNKSYYSVAGALLSRFLHGEIAPGRLKAILRDAYDFETTIQVTDARTYLLWLGNGPTASFKDYAARLMARLMLAMRPEKKPVTVLVATSGDTGSAIGEAYRKLDGFRVYILYPSAGVSRFQKKQLDSIGANVRAIAVDGSFDDCQRLVKQAFSDPELKCLNLTSANSINIGRILPQIVYYFWAYLQVADGLEPVVFSVPSGNFGNSLACELARRMGLPVKRLIIATNSNDEFPRFLRTGIYRKVEPARACLSNAMDVGNPSNLARFFDLYGGMLDRDGVVHRKPDLTEMRKRLFSVAVSDAATLRTIRAVYRDHGIVIEPHGAVGLEALRRYRKTDRRSKAICLETASPFKFSELIRKELGLTPEMPDALKVLGNRKRSCDRLKNHYPTFKRYLIQRNWECVG